jgi:hypothetical protein
VGILVEVDVERLPHVLRNDPAIAGLRCPWPLVVLRTREDLEALPFDTSSQVWKTIGRYAKVPASQ